MFSSNLCISCGYSISDPVCRGCYIKQTKILLNDLSLHEVVDEIVLEKIKNRFPAETLNDTKCVLCRKHNVAMCRHCFSVILTNILRNLSFTEEAIENFGYNQMYGEDSLEREGILNLKNL